MADRGRSAATLATLVALLLAPVLALALALMLPGLLPASRGTAAVATGRAPGAACLAQQHLGAVLQLISAVNHDALAHGEPLGDRDVDGVACAERHLAHRHGLIGGVDDVDIGARSAALHAGLRNERRALQRIEQQQEDLRNQIALEVKTALINLGSARNEVQVANSGVVLSKEEVDQARDRFKAGVANNIEVIQAQDSLARANDNQIAALYRFNQARADLARSIGQMEKIYTK